MICFGFLYLIGFNVILLQKYINFYNVHHITYAILHDAFCYVHFYVVKCNK